MFTDVKSKAVCLLCGDSVALMKDYNVRGHFETRHHDGYKHLDTKQLLQKLGELKRSLVSKQAMFTKAKSQSEAAVNARSIVAAEVAKSGGEFVKNFMMKKKKAFLNDFGLPWDNLVGLTTDGAPAMCSHESGLVGRIWEKMKEEHLTGELTAYHCIIMRSTCSFSFKLCLWETQMLQENLSHFLCCQTMKEQVYTAVFPSTQCAEKLDFAAQKSRFELLSNPSDVESAPSNLQMELTELQCCDILKAKYESVGAAEFPCFIPDTMPHLHTQAAQTLSMFGSTFLCEHLFSLMQINKTSHRSRFI